MPDFNPQNALNEMAALANTAIASEPTKVEPPPVEVKESPEKVSPPVEAQAPGKPDEPATIGDWDKIQSPNVTKEEPKFDFASFAKKVGIEAASEDEFVQKLQSKDPLEGLPQNLKKAVEFAKKGGDFLSLLKVSQVDYTKLDPVQLYEADVIGRAADKAAAQEWLSSLSPIQKQVEGDKLKNQMIFQQNLQEQELMRELEQSKFQATQVRNQASTQLQDALDSTDTVEIGGFKLKLDSRHKTKLFNELSNSEFWKDNRYRTEKGYDIKRKIRDEFLLQNYDSVTEFLKERVKSSTLKQVANEVQNVQLEQNTGREQIEQKQESIHDTLNKNLSWRKAPAA